MIATMAMKGTQRHNNNKNIILQRVCLWFLILSIWKINDVKPESLVQPNDQDTCAGAIGPRPINQQISSPGTTVDASIIIIDDISSDDINDSGDCGGVEELNNTPGIWWWVNGTGSVIRASTCDARTQIPVKFSIFTGSSCDDLSCVVVDGGRATVPDFECNVVTKDGDGAWGTIGRAIDFSTVLGQRYYILVQEEQASSAEDDAGGGQVWINFRHPEIPTNDQCVNAIGPVPRDGTTRIIGTTKDATRSDISVGVCSSAFLHYPGVWYQILGTGGPVTVMGCGEENVDGIYFSVYNGASCDELSCVPFGEYAVDVVDETRCTSSWPSTRYTFSTRTGDRYYIYVHWAFTGADKPTGSFRFYVDDGQDGILLESQHQNKLVQEMPVPNGDDVNNSMLRASLGEPSLERFSPLWSLTVNDQCLYEFVFEFEHDDTLPVGETNFQGVCSLFSGDDNNNNVADDGIKYLEPRKFWHRFPDYIQATIGFNHLSLDWHACGHRPRGYALPHYDVSLFRATPEFRAVEMACNLVDDDTIMIPGEKICHPFQDTVEGMRHSIVPGSFAYPTLLVNVPTEFRRPPAGMGYGAAPHIGLLSWDETAVPESPLQWNDAPLTMSSYDGDIAMWQVHVPYNLVSGDEDKLTSGSASYFEATIASLPDTYAFHYDSDTKKVRFTIVGQALICREEFEEIIPTQAPSETPTNMPTSQPTTSAVPSETPTTTLAPSNPPTTTGSGTPVPSETSTTLAPFSNPPTGTPTSQKPTVKSTPIPVLEETTTPTENTANEPSSDGKHHGFVGVSNILRIKHIAFGILSLFVLY